MPYSLLKPGDEERINFDSLGISISIKTNDTGDVLTDVSTPIPSDESIVERSIANGVLLALTAFITEGMKDTVLKDPKLLEHCLSCAFDRIPDLAEQTLK